MLIINTSFQNYISPLVFIELTATEKSHVIDMSWNPGVQNSLACCLSDGSLHIIDLQDGGQYNVVSLPPQSSTLYVNYLTALSLFHNFIIYTFKYIY